MVARPRVDDSFTQKSVRYVPRVKNDLLLLGALVARHCKQNQQSARRRNNNFVLSFVEFGLPDVVAMWGLGVERVLKEVGANLVRIIRTSLNLPCILSRSRSFSS